MKHRGKPKFPPPSAFRRRSSPAPIVERDKRPIYKQKGWKESYREGLSFSRKKVFNGYFRTRLGAYKGKAIELPAGRIEFYIEKPPMDALRQHKSRHCFMPQPMKRGWFLVHKHNRLCDVGSGIIEIERILDEALSGKTGEE